MNGLGCRVLVNEKNPEAPSGIHGESKVALQGEIGFRWQMCEQRCRALQEFGGPGSFHSLHRQVLPEGFTRAGRCWVSGGGISSMPQLARTLSPGPAAEWPCIPTILSSIPGVFSPGLNLTGIFCQAKNATPSPLCVLPSLEALGEGIGRGGDTGRQCPPTPSLLVSCPCLRSATSGCSAPFTERTPSQGSQSALGCFLLPVTEGPCFLSSRGLCSLSLVMARKAVPTMREREDIRHKWGLEVRGEAKCLSWRP